MVGVLHQRIEKTAVAICNYHQFALLWFNENFIGLFVDFVYSRIYRKHRLKILFTHADSAA